MSTIRETIRVHVARIRCDRCGRVASPSYHGEETEAADLAMDEGWLVSDDADVCPECAEKADG